MGEYRLLLFGDLANLKFSSQFEFFLKAGPYLAGNFKMLLLVVFLAIRQVLKIL